MRPWIQCISIVRSKQGEQPKKVLMGKNSPPQSVCEVEKHVSIEGVETRLKGYKW